MLPLASISSLERTYTPAELLTPAWPADRDELVGNEIPRRQIGVTLTHQPRDPRTASVTAALWRRWEVPHIIARARRGVGGGAAAA